MNVVIFDFFGFGEYFFEYFNNLCGLVISIGLMWVYVKWLYFWFFLMKFLDLFKNFVVVFFGYVDID